MKIKIDPTDALFSQYIKIRDDFTCQRCHKKYIPNENGRTPGLTNSHYFGRANEGTRFDPQNADTLCFGCHKIWGSDDKEAYRDFKIEQLGEMGFKELRIRADTYCKKDRKLAKIFVQSLINNLKQNGRGKTDKFPA